MVYLKQFGYAFLPCNWLKRFTNLVYNSPLTAADAIPKPRHREVDQSKKGEKEGAVEEKVEKKKKKKKKEKEKKGKVYCEFAYLIGCDLTISNCFYFSS